MKTRIHSTLPQEARRIREEVFVREQGFENDLMKRTRALLI